MFQQTTATTISRTTTIIPITLLKWIIQKQIMMIGIMLLLFILYNNNNNYPLLHVDSFILHNYQHDIVYHPSSYSVTTTTTTTTAFLSQKKQEISNRSRNNIRASSSLSWGLTSRKQIIRIDSSSTTSLSFCLQKYFMNDIMNANDCYHHHYNSVALLQQKQRSHTTRHFLSSQFEADLYKSSSSQNNNDNDNTISQNRLNDDYDNDNVYADSSIVSNTQEEIVDDVLSNETQLVIGINKYSHDTSICIADANTGQVYVGISKERISRRKHDGGNIVSLIETCILNNPIFINIDIMNVINNPIKAIIMNHHHYRIIPFIENNSNHMEWESHLNMNHGNEDGYDEIENTLLHIKYKQHELSHHLAHAYSTIIQSPYDTGLCFVLDGMGDTYRTMYTAIQKNDTSYTSDLNFCHINPIEENDNIVSYDIQHTFTCIPSNIQNDLQYNNIYDYREGESIYMFTKYHNNRSIDIKPIFKRFIKEHVPPILSNNYGFENMDSVGALYSRVSSHIFGDWNSCGKVMGLAPWYHHEWNVPSTTAATISQQQEQQQNEEAPIKTKTKQSKSKNIIIKPPPLIHPYKNNDNKKKKTNKNNNDNNNRIMWGKLYSENPNECFQYDRSYMEGMPYITRNDPDLFYMTNDGELQTKKRYDFDDNDDTYNERIIPSKVALDAISLAYHIQKDLEDIVLDLIQYYVKQTNSTNICLAGGVIQNSVLNGKISSQYGYNNVFISPYPGDDGIAVGCCAFGLYRNINLPTYHNNNDNNLFGTVTNQYEKNNQHDDVVSSVKTTFISSDMDVMNHDNVLKKKKNDMWNQPLSPYLGIVPTELEMKDAIDNAQLWLEYEIITDVNERLDIMAKEIEKGAVIAWYQSQSEFGPRALGHRSILADPRKKDLVRFINQYVKKRETFRPFAPSILAEEVINWFDDISTSLGPHNNDGNISPYMSITAMVKLEKRSLIPAVTHVDGSSRMQTVTKMNEPLYCQLIQKFFELTGIPMILNTSFNTLPKEPIVETPKDAIRSFLYSLNSIEMLVLGPYIIRRKKPNLKHLLGEINYDGTIMKTYPAYPKRAGNMQFQTSGNININSEDNNDNDVVTPTTTTKVRMPNRPVHASDKNEWVELLDDLESEILVLCDGTNTLNDIMEQFGSSSNTETTTTTTTTNNDTDELDDRKTLLQNIVHRLVRLYEETLIGW